MLVCSRPCWRAVAPSQVARIMSSPMGSQRKQEVQCCHISSPTRSRVRCVCQACIIKNAASDAEGDAQPRTFVASCSDMQMRLQIIQMAARLLQPLSQG